MRLASVGVRGTKHYTTVELLGYPVKGMVYIVTDIHRFEQAIAVKLEEDFLRKNPRRRGNIRGAFTRFMHENKLHWSMCCGKRGRPDWNLRSLTIILLNSTPDAEKTAIRRIITAW